MYYRRKSVSIIYLLFLYCTGRLKNNNVTKLIFNNNVKKLFLYEL